MGVAATGALDAAGHAVGELRVVVHAALAALRVASARVPDWGQVWG